MTDNKRVDVDALQGHTPGPWVVEYEAVDEEDGWVPIYRWLPQTGDMIATVMTEAYLESNTGTQAGNAALIAAAPDLLAEVVRLRDALNTVRVGLTHNITGFDVLAVIDAALGGRDD